MRSGTFLSQFLRVFLPTLMALETVFQSISDRLQERDKEEK